MYIIGSVVWNLLKYCKTVFMSGTCVTGNFCLNDNTSCRIST
jgi:hypothetical protein